MKRKGAAGAAPLQDARVMMAGYLTWGALSLVGAGAFWMALGFGWGAGPRIGSAHMPLLLSGLLAGTAVLGLLKALLGREAEAETLADWRPFGAVTVAVVLFITTIQHIGMIPTTLLCMFVAYLGQSEQGYAAFLAYAVGFAALVWLIFSKGLGLPVPAFGG